MCAKLSIFSQSEKGGLTDPSPLATGLNCHSNYRASYICDEVVLFPAPVSCVPDATEARGGYQCPELEIYNLEGSLFKWANEGRPLVDINSKPTVYAHPYSAIWGKLLKSELRKWERPPP